MISLLNVDDLSIQYSTDQGRIQALDRTALTVADGETVGIVGESGSGKSTLALALGRILPPNANRTAGDILFEDRSVFDLSDAELRSFRRNQLGFIFQNPVTALDPTMRIRSQLAFVLDTTSSDPAIGLSLERVGLKDVDRVVKRYPHQLSGGMAQRVVIAMAIARRPRLLIADEPTSSLDSTIRDQIMELLFSLPTQTGASLLLFTHDLRSVARYCERVVVMYGGAVVEDSTKDRFFSRPAHPYTKALVRAAPGTESIGQRIEAIPGWPSILRRPSEQCAFAPRCQWAVDVCWNKRPEPRAVDGRQVLCHRAEEVSSASELTPPAGDDYRA